MKIRLVELQRRHAAVAKEVETQVLNVLRSGGYIGGPIVANAEATAADWLGCQWGIGVNSGTDALLIALQAVGVRPGHEVIVPALSFFSTAGAVAALGATPVFIDVDESGCWDLSCVEDAITTKTQALMPVHLYGNLAGLPEVRLPVIEDAAQSIGAEPGRVGGTLSCLSTYPTKTWGAAGDGGFICGDSPGLQDHIRRLANHGGPEHHDVHGLVGRNSRLDALQAAVLLGHLPELATRVRKRREHAQLFDAHLPSWIRPLRRTAGSAVHQYVVRVTERSTLRQYLSQRGIETRVYYPRPLNQWPAFDNVPAVKPPTPMANQLCNEILALPVHADLTAVELEYIIDTLQGAR